MKYILIVSFILFSFSNSVCAQTNFGVKGGVSLTFFNENQEQFGENPETEVGYFGGVFLDVPISETFHIQPEVLYKGVGEFRFINAPIYAEYYVGRDFSLLVGPSLNYFFDFFTNSFKVRADVSAAYHFSENVEVNLKYTLGFEELTPNVLFLGLGFSL
jgi:hypothetical protein|tara:strand:- start:30058 stop:30534 length:477 start_codon:yes stop_codon:yes gene_type:complete